MKVKSLAVLSILFAAILSILPVPVKASASNGYELLIIAPDEFVNALQPLKDFKDATNRPTLLLSLEEIYANFDGSDTAEKVKRCIVDHESTSGIGYVLLVGDSDKLPVRYIYKKRINSTENLVQGMEYLPTDLYYADLYYNGTEDFCSWDANGNGLYGEILYDFAVEEWDEPDQNIDDLDLRPDVAVGRVPASSIIEVENYVDKVITYELYCSPHLEWFKKALFVSGVDSGMWPPEEIPQLNKIADLLQGLGFTTIKLYDDSYPSDGVPNPTSINSYLNDGVGFMNVHCHGERWGWTCNYDVPSDMTGLSNEDCLPIMYSMSCLIGAYAPLPCKGYPQGESYVTVDGETFTIDPVPTPEHPISMDEFTEPPKPNPLQNSVTDKESPTEYFLVYDLRGAIASIASSDLALAGNTEYLNSGFFDGYEEDHRVLGDIWNHGINYYCDNYWVDPTTGKGGSISKLARYHLFGDPSLVVKGPPVTTKTLGNPRYVSSDCIGGMCIEHTYATSNTPHTLVATDDSAVAASYYRYHHGNSTPPPFELYADPFVIEGDDGSYIIEYYSVDDGNWDEPVKSQVEYLDNTPPTITINSPIAKDYSHSETIIIDFDVTDGVSGVAQVSALLDGSMIHDGEVIDLVGLPLSSHTLAITAEDNLGNRETDSVIFNVEANVDSLIALIERFYTGGQIDDPQVRDGLLDKLNAAKALIDANKAEPARKLLRAFIHQVEAQQGKHITEAAANILLTDAKYTIGHL